MELIRGTTSFLSLMIFSRCTAALLGADALTLMRPSEENVERLLRDDVSLAGYCPVACATIDAMLQLHLHGLWLDKIILFLSNPNCIAWQ